MNATPEAPERFAPDNLLRIFSKTPFLKYLVLALVIHLVLTLATSVPYMLDRIYPERVEQRENARKERERKEAEAKRPKQPAASATENAAVSADASEKAPQASASAPTSEAELLKAHSNAPVVKEITEMPKPGEIPATPDELGISIDQTNPR